MRVRIGSKLLLLTVALGLGACGSSDKGGAAAKLSLVDPNDAYGMSYAEWSAAWVSYVNSVSPPECSNPLMDATGVDCALYQDDESPVFFLVGNYGGVSVRSECVAPAGKALFFPVLNIWGDNAGVPSDMVLSDDDIRAYVESQFDNMLPDSTHVAVDGVSVEDPALGGSRSAPYLLELAPMANTYYCAGAEDVEGEFPGYSSGYWAMLAPLEPGAHVVEFGGAIEGSAAVERLTIDQRYELTVE